MNVIRVVPNVPSKDFEATRSFYAAMFDLVVSVELDDWHLQLMPESNAALNVGFVKPDQGPAASASEAAVTVDGLLLTIHVDDVDEAYQRARRLGAEIRMAVRNEEYGQRHFIVLDPNGVRLNVMSAVQPWAGKRVFRSSKLTATCHRSHTVASDDEDSCALRARCHERFGERAAVDALTFVLRPLRAL